MYHNQGIVSVIESKEFEGRGGRGPVTLWSFQLEGNRRWFRTGRVEPEFMEGDNIGFENNEKGEVDLETLVFDPEPQRRPSRPAGRGGAARSGGRTGGARSAGGRGGARPQSGGNDSGGVTRDGYWANKEARDIEREKRYQEVDVPRMSLPSAREAAIRVVEVALANGALKLGTKQQFDTLVKTVDEMTDKFFADNMNAHNRLKEVATGGAGQNEPPEDFDDLEDENWDEE